MFRAILLEFRWRLSLMNRKVESGIYNRGYEIGVEDFAEQLRAGFARYKTDKTFTKSEVYALIGLNAEGEWQ